MLIIEQHTAKGLFAAAERYDNRAGCSAMMSMAAHMALSLELIRRDDQPASLADIEQTLRQWGSAVYLFASPPEMAAGAGIYGSTYTWIEESVRETMPDPQYTLEVARGVKAAQAAYNRLNLTPERNMIALETTGLPLLPATKAQVNELLHLCPQAKAT